MDYSMHYSTASVGEYSINILFNVVYNHFAIELLLVSTLFFFNAVYYCQCTYLC